MPWFGLLLIMPTPIFSVLHLLSGHLLSVDSLHADEIPGDTQVRTLFLASTVLHARKEDLW